MADTISRVGLSYNPAMRPQRSSPAELTDDWPHRPSTDPDAEAIRLLAVRLGEVTEGLSLRRIGEITGVNHSVIGDVLAGRKWPDTQTLARLERGLEARLWPELGTAGHHVPAAGEDVVRGEGPQQ